MQLGHRSNGVWTLVSTGWRIAPAKRPEWIGAFLEMKTIRHPIGL
jgi:hypothetical protein